MYVCMYAYVYNVYKARSPYLLPSYSYSYVAIMLLLWLAALYLAMHRREKQARVQQDSYDEFLLTRGLVNKQDDRGKFH